MHYRNGREAKNGDRIVQIDFDSAQVRAVGTLADAVPDNDYCNGSVKQGDTVVAVACLCDCLHADDLAALLAEKGLDKRPAGK